MQPATTAADLAIPACFLIAEPEKVSLSDCLINVDVQSRIAIIEQTQEFHNRSDEVQEVTYAFPDGGDGVFLEMTACLDGQEVVLEVRENTKAEKIYEQARDEGNLPVLSKNLGEGVNCIHLGKLAPGSRVQVKSRFAAPIKFIGDRGQLRIPTTIAPRYGINRDAQRAQAMPAASLLAEHPLKLSVALGGAMRHLEVSCPSHQLKTVAAANGGDRKCRMLFEDAYKDRDIVLQFAGRPPANMGFAVNNPFVKPAGRVVWLDVLADAAKTTHPKNLHFLIDCSGSMHGDGQRLAGEFLKSFADLIDEKDTIGISIFGSGYQLLFAGQPGAQINQHTFINAASASMGGTELGRALQATLADRHEGADIVLVTDGHVGEGAELVKRMHNSNCRIFAVGIGAAPRQSLLESLATATEGNCDFLSANMDSDKIAKSCAQLAECGRQRISAISWSGSAKPNWHSPLPQTIYPDVPLPIAAFFDGDQVPAQATVIIDGKKSVVAIDDLGDGRSRELSKLAAARHCKS
ncbi:MAG: VIT and VWA domain-containing protein, partial [Betaproteobacteria bacterium]|nr:VIT and VWA domain-containing protein [Betaproteobacteria bacterium]